MIDAVICGWAARDVVRRRTLGRQARPDHVRQGVTSGYLPLGACVVSGAVAAPFFEQPGGPMRAPRPDLCRHPTCARRGHDRDLRARGHHLRGQRLEGELRDALAPLASHPAVGEIRSGLDCSPPSRSPTRRSPDPGAVAKVAAGTREAGVIVRPLLGALAISPPLVVEREHLDEIAAGVRAGLDAL